MSLCRLSLVDQEAHAHRTCTRTRTHTHTPALFCRPFQHFSVADMAGAEGPPPRSAPRRGQRRGTAAGELPLCAIQPATAATATTAAATTARSVACDAAPKDAESITAPNAWVQQVLTDNAPFHLHVRDTHLSQPWPGAINYRADCAILCICHKQCSWAHPAHLVQWMQAYRLPPTPQPHVTEHLQALANALCEIHQHINYDARHLTWALNNLRMRQALRRYENIQDQACPRRADMTWVLEGLESIHDPSCGEWGIYDSNWRNFPFDTNDPSAPLCYDMSEGYRTNLLDLVETTPMLYLTRNRAGHPRWIHFNTGQALRSIIIHTPVSDRDVTATADAGNAGYAR